MSKHLGEIIPLKVLAKTYDGESIITSDIYAQIIKDSDGMYWTGGAWTNSTTSVNLTHVGAGLYKYNIDTSDADFGAVTSISCFVWSTAYSFLDTIAYNFTLDEDYYARSSTLITINNMVDTVESVLETSESAIMTIKEAVLTNTQTTSMLDTLENYHWNDSSMLDTIKTYTNIVESQIDTNESLLYSIKGSTTDIDTSRIETLEDYHWSLMDKFESVIDNTTSYAATNYDEHIDTQSRIETVKDYVDTVESKLDTNLAEHNTTQSMIDTNQSMLTTVKSFTDYVESQIDTNQSLLTTVKTFTDNVESQIDTNQSLLTTVKTFTDFAESQLDTMEDYHWDITSKVNTCQSFLLWDMDGLGTGKYYYNQDGYYRNTDLTGTIVPWSTGDVGAIYYGGTPLENVVVTVFIVTNNVRTRNIADQTYTDENGNYHGYLDPGSYSFHFHKDGYIDEYHDRTLVEA